MAGKKAFGSKFSYSIDGNTYIDYANVHKIIPFALKAAVIDVTDHNSPGEFKEKLSGIKDAGAAKVSVNYDDKNITHRAAASQLAAGTELFLKLTGPGASPTVATFKGFVNGVSPEYPYDNKQACDIDIEITGVVTIV